MIEQYGFVRVGVASPKLKVADVEYNTKQIISCAKKLSKKEVQIVVFPELSICSYTCGDLFYQNLLEKKCRLALLEISSETKKLNISLVVGTIIRNNNNLFNCAAFISDGKICGIVPKTFLPKSNEYYETRWFSSANINKSTHIDFKQCNKESKYKISDSLIPFGTDLIFQNKQINDLKIGIEICEDLWTVKPPSFDLTLSGANLILNLSSSNELIGKSEYRRDLVRQQSARCICAYAYASSSPHESTTDMIFSGHSMICENGEILVESERLNLESSYHIADIDLEKIICEKIRNTSFSQINNNFEYRVIYFSQKSNFKNNNLIRKILPHPFIPKSKNNLDKNCKEIFNLQATALCKRLIHINCNSIVIGISGGLDSTLALLVCINAFKKLNIPTKNILAISMPGFGTSKKTYNNTQKLAKLLQTSFESISIKKSVLQHFKDISHDKNVFDVTYENSQARERTQILMDIANKKNAIVIGTGDLSELALGWCTFNGDHMSMYNINCGVPKTLVKYIIKWYGNNLSESKLKKVLIDIYNTPISPELLPLNKQGSISQKTENSIGPYELHDFFLYNIVKNHYKPKKILFLAEIAFKNTYSKNDIKKYLKIFIKRFFSNQFKRSSMPDGPKIGSVALSPRSDWRMPSDASYNLWLNF